MSRVQLKTLERLVAGKLRSDNSDYKIQAAYHKTKEVFDDVAFLTGVPHDKIIDAIYVDGYYEHKSARNLGIEFCLNVKTLLSYRRCYLEILAKYYLGLLISEEDDLVRFYDELTAPEK